MKPSKLLFLLSLILLASNLQVFSQVQNNQEYHPQVGQEGKDVVWVPTPQALVEKMLDLGKVSQGDILYDLGSGDGRTVITAAKRGIQAFGIEYNPEMVKLSRNNAEKEGVSEKAKFEEADLFETDLSKATVITMFLLPEINLKLRPKILDLKPGTRIVSNTFTMEEWQPDDTAIIDDQSASWNTAYLWIVPAKAEGEWKMPDGEMNLVQNFQMISGSIRTGGKSFDISEGKLNGNIITLSAGGCAFKGTAASNKIEGIMTCNGKTDKWNAER